MLLERWIQNTNYTDFNEDKHCQVAMYVYEQGTYLICTYISHFHCISKWHNFCWIYWIMTDKEQRSQNILYQLFTWITVSCHFFKEGIYQIPYIILPQENLSQNQKPKFRFHSTLFFFFFFRKVALMLK